MIDGIKLTGIEHEQSLVRGVDRVRYVMQQGGWWTYWELQQKIWINWGRQYSEACLSARIRDLRKPEHGGHTIPRRKRAGTDATFEYCLVDHGPNQDQEAA